MTQDVKSVGRCATPKCVFSCWVKWAGFDRCLIPPSLAFEWWAGNAQRTARDRKPQRLRRMLLQTVWFERVRFIVRLAHIASPVSWWCSSKHLMCTVRAFAHYDKKYSRNKSGALYLFTLWMLNWRRDCFVWQVAYFVSEFSRFYFSFILLGSIWERLLLDDIEFGKNIYEVFSGRSALCKHVKIV